MATKNVHVTTNRASLERKSLMNLLETTAHGHIGFELKHSGKQFNDKSNLRIQMRCSMFFQIFFHRVNYTERLATVCSSNGLKTGIQVCLCTFLGQLGSFSLVTHIRLKEIFVSETSLGFFSPFETHGFSLFIQSKFKKRMKFLKSESAKN